MKEWIKEVQTAFRTLEELLEYLKLNKLPYTLYNPKQFPLLLPRNYANKIEKSNPYDPLLLQILPLKEEKIAQGEKDPLQELHFIKNPGFIHRHKNKVLVISTGSCPVHCRYCFRRHFPYTQFSQTIKNPSPLINYIKKHSNIKEIILSGGDPLSLTDELLLPFLEKLEPIENLKIIRLHTRFITMIPERVTPQLLEILTLHSKKIVVVIHVNHPNEIGDKEEEILKKVTLEGITVLNQSVLLKNVNDKAEILEKLSYKLFNANVIPYYLHLMDKVEGGRHFEVPFKKAKAIYLQLLENLPGYLVPKMVVDPPASKHKKLILPD